MFVYLSKTHTQNRAILNVPGSARKRGNLKDLESPWPRTLPLLPVSHPPTVVQGRIFFPWQRRSNECAHAEERRGAGGDGSPPLPTASLNPVLGCVNRQERISKPFTRLYSGLNTTLAAHASADDDARVARDFVVVVVVGFSESRLCCCRV